MIPWDPPGSELSCSAACILPLQEENRFSRLRLEAAVSAAADAAFAAANAVHNAVEAVQNMQLGAPQTPETTRDRIYLSFTRQGLARLKQMQGLYLAFIFENHTKLLG